MTDPKPSGTWLDGDEVQTLNVSKELGAPGDESSGGAAGAPGLDGAEHQVEVLGCAARLDLAKGDRPSTGSDEVQLAACRPHVACENAPASPHEVARGGPFGAPSKIMCVFHVRTMLFELSHECAGGGSAVCRVADDLDVVSTGRVQVDALGPVAVR